MKRTKNILLVALLIIMIALVALAAKAMDNNRGSKNGSEDSAARSAAESEDKRKLDVISGKQTGVDGETQEDWRTITGDLTLEYMNDTKMEFISCDVIEDKDIETQTKYPADNFYDEVLPDGDDIQTVTDWKTIYKEAPELKEAHDQPTETDEDLDRWLAMKEKYSDLIASYTSDRHINTRYYFVKCRLTNETDEKIEDILMPDIVQVSSEDGTITQNDSFIYFDSSVNTNGNAREHSFMEYSLNAGESMECTLGFSVRYDDDPDVNIYIGESPVTDESYDPGTIPNLVRVNDIPMSE